MIVSANMAKQFDARIKKMFFMEFTQYSEFRNLVNVMSSSKQYERVATVGEMPMPDVVGELESFPQARFYPGPQREWIHEKYGYKTTASQEMLDDELFGVVAKSAQAAGVAMGHRYETQGIYDFDVAFTLNTVGPSDTASETLCATSHATFAGSGGDSQSNRPNSDITIGVDSLWAAINNFSGLHDRENNPIVKIPKKLVAHAVNKRTMKEILGSENAPYTMNREKNALEGEGITFVPSHYLSETTAWFLMTDESPIDFYIRWPTKVDTDGNISNQSRFWVISTRISHGPRSWENIYGSTGA
jgi:hypothetical protein